MSARGHAAEEPTGLIAAKCEVRLTEEQRALVLCAVRGAAGRRRRLARRSA
jgi:hypothetical protein